MIDGKRTPVEEDHAIVVPAGAQRDIINSGDEPLLLYTLYAPPEHATVLCKKTKKDAGRAGGAFRRRDDRGGPRRRSLAAAAELLRRYRRVTESGRVANILAGGL